MSDIYYDSGDDHEIRCHSDASTEYRAHFFDDIDEPFDEDPEFTLR